MKIAVTYDNGQVFQHFGHSEAFKVYQIAEGEVVSSEVIETGASGHGALAALLDKHSIDVLICGGIGAGAQEALAGVGIEIIDSASGDADAAVEAYLKGELAPAGATCDHHHDEEEEEGCGSCGSGCGGGCGGCGGGCGRPAIEGKNVGKTCKTHYTGTLNDGTVFDSSYDRGEPLEFICGAGMMIPGFDAAVANMEVGEIVDVHIMPEDAYGYPDPNAIFPIEIAQLPGSEKLEIGQQVYLTNMYGQPFLVKVTAKDDKIVTFDANHEMAGKELNFKIELVEIKDAE